MLPTRSDCSWSTSLAVTSILASVAAESEEASVRPARLPTLYVGKFQAVEDAPSRWVHCTGSTSVCIA